jgi:hypothetical protein
MQYLLLIYSSEDVWEKKTPEEIAAVMAEYGSFTESIVKSGHFKAGEELQPVSSATTVRVRNGKAQVTHGPFAETREQLGGFYLIEADTPEQAIELAGRIPSAREGCIEVRPIMRRE